MSEFRNSGTKDYFPKMAPCFYQHQLISFINYQLFYKQNNGKIRLADLLLRFLSQKMRRNKAPREGVYITVISLKNDNFYPDLSSADLYYLEDFMRDTFSRTALLLLFLACTACTYQKVRVTCGECSPGISTNHCLRLQGQGAISHEFPLRPSGQSCHSLGLEEPTMLYKCSEMYPAECNKPGFSDAAVMGMLEELTRQIVKDREASKTWAPGGSWCMCPVTADETRPAEGQLSSFARSSYPEKDGDSTKMRFLSYTDDQYEDMVIMFMFIFVCLIVVIICIACIKADEKQAMQRQKKAVDQQIQIQPGSERQMMDKLDLMRYRYDINRYKAELNHTAPIHAYNAENLPLPPIYNEHMFS